MASRAEHRRSTLLKLSAATTDAFEQLGAAATFDDIAERAGVSRRTIFRYVKTKEELVYIHPVLWFDIFDEAIGELAETPVRDRLLAAAHSVSAAIDADPQPVARAMRVAQLDPTLMRGYASISRRWIDRIATEVLGDDTDGDAIFRSRVLGAAVMGVIDAALGVWLASEPRPSVVDLVEQGLDYLAPILD